MIANTRANLKPVCSRHSVVVIRSAVKDGTSVQIDMQRIIMRWRDLGQGSVCCYKNTVAHGELPLCDSMRAILLL